MYDQLSPVDGSDKSPFVFYKVDWLNTRITELYKNYLAYKQAAPIRVESNHLLIKLLSNITVEFDGDLTSYMAKVDTQVRRISGPNGVTSATARGDVFKDVFYKGGNNVVTMSRNSFEPIDLWWGWKNVTAVTVHAHPVTELELFDLVVEGSPVSMKPEDYVLVNIDLPLLAGQYRMYKSNVPNGNYESFISQYVVPGMMKSHLDIVLFNNVCKELGVMEERKIKTNLGMAQPDLSPQLNSLAKEVAEALLNRAMTPRQILATIPTLLSKGNVLNKVLHPSLLVNQQSLWALHSHSVDKASLVLEVAKRRNHYDRALALVTRIRRDNIILNQEGWYRNALRSTTTAWLMRRWENVLGRLPEELSLEALEAMEGYEGF